MRSERAKRVVIRAVSVLAVALALGMPSSASSSLSSQEPPPPEELTVTAADDGSGVELSEGQVLVISLEANPSTGYSWQLADGWADLQGDEILRQMGAPEFEPQSDLLGAPGTQTLRFEPVAEGHADLGLLYRRPWEPYVVPAKTFSLSVQAAGPSPEVSPVSPTPEGVSAVEATTAAEDRSEEDLPSAFNWCDFGACTPVRDQGECGSCWAFGTVGPLEMNLLIQGGPARDLSEQYLVSCNVEGWGCNGGWFAHDYHAWKVPPDESGPGAVVETDFPYVHREDPCNAPHVHPHKIDSWHDVGSDWTAPSVAEIKKAIYEHGPVSASVCVNVDFQHYSGGVFEGPGCLLPNHAVVLVGWDDDQGANGVWILRNSWGAEWGEGGYMRIGYGVSSVGFGANYVEYSPSSCYSLTTAANPSGGGTITADPLPNCDTDGYEPGTEVELTALPSSSWHFGEWSGGATGDSHTVLVVMDSHKSVTAHFSPDVCLPWLTLPLGVAACWFARRRGRVAWPFRTDKPE